MLSVTIVVFVRRSKDLTFNGIFLLFALFIVLRGATHLFGVLALWRPLQAEPTTPMAGAKMMDKNVMEHCQELKEAKQKMIAEMTAQDGELALQVAKMNGAPEDKKLGLMAALVTQLVEQRATRNAQLGKMQAATMNHLAQHIVLGKESLSQCPMLQGMEDIKGGRDLEELNGMADASADAQKEHH